MSNDKTTNWMKKFRKPTNKPEEENRVYRYVLLEEKILEVYELNDQPLTYRESTAQELLDEDEERIHYSYHRPMHLIGHSSSGNAKFPARGISLSSESMLVQVDSTDIVEELEVSGRIQLQFKLYPGDMRESYRMNVKVTAELVNSIYTEDGEIICVFRMRQPLAFYDNKKRRQFMQQMAVAGIFGMLVCLILTYSESIWCLRYNSLLYSVSIVTLLFATIRALCSACYRPMRINRRFYPGVTIVISGDGEESHIQKTLSSCMNQKYPKVRMEMMILQGRNKEEALKEASDKGRFPFVIWLREGCELHPNAIQHLMQPFQDEKMGIVSGSTRITSRGRTLVSELCAMFAFYRFRVKKAREALSDCVLVPSDDFCCYRKEFLQEGKTIRDFRTGYQDSALSFKEENLNGGEFFVKKAREIKKEFSEECKVLPMIIKKEPFILALSYVGEIVYCLFPFFFIYGVIFVPAIFHIVPAGYIVAAIVVFVYALSSVLKVTGLGVSGKKSARGGQENEK